MTGKGMTPGSPGRYKWMVIWFAAAMVFGAGTGVFMGRQAAVDFFGGYFIELSLSIDNLFVFLLLFSSFKVPEPAQHRALRYGIAGVIVLRFLFIFLGISLIRKFEWVLYVFGAVLILSGVRMAAGKDDEKDPREGYAYRLARKVLPVAGGFAGEKFFVRNEGEHFRADAEFMGRRAKYLVTPLFVVLLLVESSDIIFAIDSVPAVFSITTDIFIVYTSNIFAILGLRQLFFVIEDAEKRFKYVKYGVSLLLCFTGVKMLAGVVDIHINNLLSVIVIVCILVTSIAVSIFASRCREK